MPRQRPDRGEQLDGPIAQKGFEALSNTFRNVGTQWRRCDGSVDLIVGLRSAACAFDDFSRDLARLDDRLDSGRYRRIADLFREAASRLNIALKADRPELGMDAYLVAEPFVLLGNMFNDIARSAEDSGDADQVEQLAALRTGLQSLRAVGAELLFMGSVIGQVTPEIDAVSFVPHFEASLVRMGDQLTIAAASIVVVGGALVFCRDRCSPCGTAAGPYTFTGRFQVAVVQGGLRRVDPIFSTTACCTEPCLVILSRCINKTVEKVVPAPDRVALTNPAGVAAAQAQIRALINAGRLAPPAFVAADCP